MKKNEKKKRKKNFNERLLTTGDRVHERNGIPLNEMTSEKDFSKLYTIIIAIIIC